MVALPPLVVAFLLVALSHVVSHSNSFAALGDQNTRFFHHKMKSRCLKSKFLSLKDGSGVRLTAHQKVNAKILGYYEGLLGTSFARKRGAYQVFRLLILRKQVLQL